jgi:hypothetical protein
MTYDCHLRAPCRFSKVPDRILLVIGPTQGFWSCKGYYSEPVIWLISTIWVWSTKLGAAGLKSLYGAPLGRSAYKYGVCIVYCVCKANIVLRSKHPHLGTTRTTLVTKCLRAGRSLIASSRSGLIVVPFHSTGGIKFYALPHWIVSTTLSFYHHGLCFAWRVRLLCVLYLTAL